MTRKLAPRKRARSFERQVLRLSFLTGALGTGTAVLLLWTGDYTGKVLTYAQWYARMWLGGRWI